MIKDEIEFKLVKPILHHKGGESIECKVLILHAPSAANRKYTTRLKQAFMRAINSMNQGKGNEAPSNQDAVDEAKKELTGVNVCGLLLMSDIDLNECYENLKEILLNGTAFIDKEKIMSKMHFEQLCDEDIELILGEYIANFLIPSWMRQAMKN
jgi:hypothetical protein